MTLQYSTCSFKQQDTLIAVSQHMNTIFFSPIAAQIITFNGNIPKIKINSQEKRKASLPLCHSLVPQTALPHAGALWIAF